MNSQEQTAKIAEIYNEAIKKLKELGIEREKLLKEKKDIINDYIKELEAQKIEAIRASILLSDNK